MDQQEIIKKVEEIRAARRAGYQELLERYLGTHGDAVYREMTRLDETLSEFEHLFELQHRRMGEAVALWRAESAAERELVAPDLGELLRWLIARGGGLARARQKAKRLSDRLEWEAEECAKTLEKLKPPKDGSAHGWDDAIKLGAEAIRKRSPR